MINVIEKYGSGFIRIRNTLKDYPEVEFDIKEFQGGVMATFTLKQPEPVTPQVNALLAVLQGEMTRHELMERLGLKDRKNFSENYLQSALKYGMIKMTIPEKPNSRVQKYRLTTALPATDHLETRL